MRTRYSTSGRSKIKKSMRRAVVWKSLLNLNKIQVFLKLFRYIGFRLNLMRSRNNRIWHSLKNLLHICKCLFLIPRYPIFVPLNNNLSNVLGIWCILSFNICYNLLINFLILGFLSPITLFCWTSSIRKAFTHFGEWLRGRNLLIRKTKENGFFWRVVTLRFSFMN